MKEVKSNELITTIIMDVERTVKVTRILKKHMFRVRLIVPDNNFIYIATTFFISFFMWIIYQLKYLFNYMLNLNYYNLFNEC